MTLEKELQEVMKAGTTWKGSEEELWERVARSVDPNQRKWHWPTVAWAAPIVASAAVVLMLIWTGHLTFVPFGTSTPGHNSPSLEQPPASGQAQVIPSMSGTVSDVKDGIVDLTGVTDSLRPSKPPAALFRVSVPSGTWISKNHWRSDDGMIDLFRGQSVSYFTERKRIVPELMFGKGDVLRRDGQTLTVRITEGMPEVSVQNGVATNVQVDPGAYSFLVAPYTHADREIKAGDKVILGVFGEPGDQIIWQVTFLN